MQPHSESGYFAMDHETPIQAKLDYYNVSREDVSIVLNLLFEALVDRPYVYMCNVIDRMSLIDINARDLIKSEIHDEMCRVSGDITCSTMCSAYLTAITEEFWTGIPDDFSMYLNHKKIKFISDLAFAYGIEITYQF